MKKKLSGLLILVSLVVSGCGAGGTINDATTTTTTPTTTPTTQTAIVSSVKDVSLQFGLSTASTATMIADGAAKIAVRAVVTNQAGTGMANVSVAFSTTKGTLTGGGTTAVAVTNASGVAAVELTAPTTTGNATVIADVSGLSKQGPVSFVAGTPDPLKSIITVLPTTLLADGVSSALVTVRLVDANSNPVPDGTAITMNSDMGTLIRRSLYLVLNDGNPNTNSDNILGADNYNTTTSGRAEFVITSSTSPGPVSLWLAEYSGITKGMTFGAVSSGNPSNIQFTTASNHIAVSGVGQPSQTIFSLKVIDDGGKGINELTYDNKLLNNVRVRFVTRPNGGEYLVGRDTGSNIVDTRTSSFIDIRTDNGEANLTLQSGTLPGNVEILAEALVDKNGQPLASTVLSSSPLVVISSGPPHSIVLTTPIKDSIKNLGGGVYQRVGKALVNDRWGNTVPDGTSIYLGLYDSIVASGAASSLSGTNVTAATGTFNGVIIRNDALRKVQPGDHVIFTNLVEAQDKHRTVAAATSATALTVNDSFTQSYPLPGQTNPQYFVGASLSGGSIGGTDPANADAAQTGATYTKDGIANIFVTYPADSEHIMIGCNPDLDTRTLPMGHSRVGAIAKSSASPTLSNDRATTVNDNGLFCFSPIAGFSVTAAPSKLSSSGMIGLGVRDGGDTVSVPFYPVLATVTIDKLGTYGICSVLDPGPPVKPITTQADCEARAGVWTINKSDFKVRAYVNTITTAASVDLDGDGFNDISYTNVGDVNGNDIPDDLNGDGVIDIAEAYLVLDISGDFYAYPYTLEGGVASASVVVTGDKLIPGDAATVTFQIGDGSADVKVVIP